MASMTAVFTGTAVLFLPKGTSKHAFIGRVYALCMIVVLFTAFNMYHLFGRWGIFHWSALLSTATLICGLFPIWLKWPRVGYRSLHFSFMYWSIMGVYGALVAETLVRIPKVVVNSGVPNSVFFSMTGIGTGIVMGLAGFFFIKYKPKWEKQFGER